MLRINWGITTLGLLVVCLHAGSALAFKEIPENAVDDPAAKQLLIEREIAKDKAQRDFIEKRNTPKESPVVMKIRDKGAAPGERGQVIAQMNLTAEEFAAGNVLEKYKTLETQAGLAAPASAARSAASYELPRANRIANTLLLAGIGIIGLGWWYFRRYDYTG